MNGRIGRPKWIFPVWLSVSVFPRISAIVPATTYMLNGCQMPGAAISVSGENWCSWVFLPLAIEYDCLVDIDRAQFPIERSCSHLWSDRMPQKNYEQAVFDACEALHEARQLVLAELKAYPTPISACDQQYVRLLADRTRISNAIQTLRNHPFVATPRVLESDAISWVSHWFAVFCFLRKKSV